jgi:hypothetical protein
MFLRNSMSRGIARAEVVVPQELEHNVLETAIDALEFAKEQAPWEDRTGDARDGLDVDVSWEGENIVWQMFHTVDYGLYLETRWNGKYSVIMPTLELFAPQIGRGLSESGGNYGG